MKKAILIFTFTYLLILSHNFSVLLPEKSILLKIHSLLAEFYIIPILFFSSSVIILYNVIKKFTPKKTLHKILIIFFILIFIIPTSVFFIHNFYTYKGSNNFLYTPGHRPNIDWSEGIINISFKNGTTNETVYELLRSHNFTPNAEFNRSNLGSPLLHSYKLHVPAGEEYKWRYIFENEPTVDHVSMSYKMTM